MKSALLKFGIFFALACACINIDKIAPNILGENTDIVGLFAFFVFAIISFYAAIGVIAAAFSKLKST